MIQCLTLSLENMVPMRDLGSQRNQSNRALTKTMKSSYGRARRKSIGINLRSRALPQDLIMEN